VRRGWNRRGCSGGEPPDGVDVGRFEPLAQAIHERWRQEAIVNGETAPTWQDLDESRKNSSRDQARVTSRSTCASNFTFTDPEIELLAAAEHERWKPERIADGWTLADEKNVEQNQTPYLLPWKQLKKRHPDIAELDTVLIRAMPAILASAGGRSFALTRARSPTANDLRGSHFNAIIFTAAQAGEKVECNAPSHLPAWRRLRS
jgi:RyR domain